MGIVFTGLPPGAQGLMPAGSRAVREAGGAGELGGEGAAGAPMSFSAFLDQALAQVEADQRQAAAAAVDLASGQTEDLVRAMVASEKATLSLQLTVTVRNKVLEAYQEIMRMPL